MEDIYMMTDALIQSKIGARLRTFIEFCLYIIVGKSVTVYYIDGTR